MNYDRCSACEARERRAREEAAIDAAHFGPEYDPDALRPGLLYFRGDPATRMTLLRRLLIEWRGAYSLIEPDPEDGDAPVGVALALTARELGGAVYWEAEVDARGWRILPSWGVLLGLKEPPRPLPW